MNNISSIKLQALLRLKLNVIVTRFASHISLGNNCVFLNGSPALHMFATEIVVSVPK